MKNAHSNPNNGPANLVIPNRPVLTRRKFIATTAAAASVFTIVPRHVLGAGEPPPSERLNIAGIGVGGMGAGNLENLKGQNIVALCDVDHDYAAKTFTKYPNARIWTDYREMLEQQKDIDAVLIATPDHTHAVIALAAMRAGKHVYLQKPLTHDVHEARTLARAAREHKVITQMGNQGHSAEGVRTLCEWIWDGAIGEIREVHAWCDLSYYPWGHAGWSSKYGERPSDTPAVPKSLNWDLWLQPKAERARHPEAFYQDLRLCGVDGCLFSVTNTPQTKKQMRKARSRRGRAAFPKVGVAVLLELGLHNPLAAALGSQGESGNCAPPARVCKATPL